MRTFAEINDHSVFYVRSGAGSRKTLLVPPLGGNTNSYGSEFDRFAASGEMVKYDWGGQGISEKYPNDYDMDLLAKELIGVLDFLGWDQVDAVGVAAGSAVIVTAALNHPERFRKLALMAPSVFISEEVGKGMRERADIVAVEGMRPSLSASISKGFAPEFGSNTELTTIYKGEYLANDPVAYSRASKAFSQYDERARISQLSQETLLLPGEFDPYFPVPVAEEMLPQLSNARLEVLEGCGHFAQLEKPKMIVDLIDGFFSE